MKSMNDSNEELFSINKLSPKLSDGPLATMFLS